VRSGEALYQSSISLSGDASGVANFLTYSAVTNTTGTRWASSIGYDEGMKRALFFGVVGLLIGDAIWMILIKNIIELNNGWLTFGAIGFLSGATVAFLIGRHETRKSRVTKSPDDSVNNRNPQN
jgi:hypothetical protein